MKHVNNKTIVIPAAGLGSRLGSFTKNYSKAMCTLGKMPVISHIINNFSNADEIIILLGYKGDFLKQVIEACHPDKNIKFVNVDKFKGEGSGLGYSLHCAYDLLQKPFLFWSCDTVLPNFNLDNCDFNKNWSIISKDRKNYNSYRHMQIGKNMEVKNILPKDANYNDSYSYVGVSNIYDFKKFWEAWDKNKDAFINSGESYGLVNLLSLDSYFCERWIDTGNKEEFEKAKIEYAKAMDENVLEKPDEAIWFIDNRVIKFHIDESFITNRITRMKTMLSERQSKNGIELPKLLYYSKNVYVYKRANGIIASKVITSNMLYDILDSFLNNIDIEKISDNTKIQIYNDFYKNKTLSRIHKYCDEYEDIDGPCVINGLNCISATELIKNVNWEKLALNGVFTNNYHGDFHLENILVNDDKFIMLDWRQNFGETFIGDIYYDIAKMWHSLIVNHNIVKDNLFRVENISKNSIRIDIHRTFIDTECEESLINYITNDNVFNIKQAELLTAVIFLNIAACHVYPYSKFLFYLGKYMLNKFFYKHLNFCKGNE